MTKKMLMSAILVAGTTLTAAQAPVPFRAFDAAQDPAGDAVLQNTSTLQGGAGQNFNFMGDTSPVAVNDPFNSLTAAWDIPSTGAIAGANWSFFGQAGGGRINHAETTYEVFFNASNLGGTHVIMEIGGSGAGVSLVLDGNELIWSSNPGGPGTETTHSVSTGIGTGWRHAVATWSRLTDTTSLYVDGELIGTVAIAPDTTGWVGGNEAGLGGLTSTSIAATVDQNSLTDFDGQIAAFNYYREALTEEQVRANFDAVFVPAPGSAALLVLGGLAGVRRR